MRQLAVYMRMWSVLVIPCCVLCRSCQWNCMDCGCWRSIYLARRVRDPLLFGCGLLVVGRCLQMLFLLWYGVAAMMLCRMCRICC